MIDECIDVPLPEACRHWGGALTTKQKLNVELGRDGDIAVATCSERDLAPTFHSIARAFHPDAVLTQLVWSERVLLWSRQLPVPTVLFARSADGEIDLSLESPYAPTAIIANAGVTQEYVRRPWRREAFIVPPLIRLEDCVSKTSVTPRFITMFNPTHEKGAHIFRAVAEGLPQRDFLVVEGWHNWKDPSGNWDVELLASAARGYGSVAAKTPELIDFSKTRNVTCMAATGDVAGIYGKTSLLLVPSVWPEPYARVIVEAMANGIPVLYSGAGSTGEAADGAGVLVRPATEPSAWITAISQLDDPSVYRLFADRSLARARRYNLSEEIDKAESVIRNAVYE